MNEHNTSENDNILIDTELKKDHRFKHDFESFKKKLVKTQINESLFGISNENNNENKLKLSLDELKKEDFKQFDLNSERFNVKSTYSENLYTTEIDYKQISDDLVQRAQSLENEILSQRSANPHLREDRGQYDPSLTEEMRYSTVERVHSTPNFTNDSSKEKKKNFNKIKKELKYFKFFSISEENKQKFVRYFFILLILFLILFQIYSFTKNKNTEEDTPSNQEMNEEYDD